MSTHYVPTRNRVTDAQSQQSAATLAHHAPTGNQMTDAQMATICALIDRLGAYDYMNEARPGRAVWVDWVSLGVCARIVPDGRWTNEYEALTA